MKLLSLNIWGATKKAELFAFLTEQAKSTDFFCFQEVLDAPEQVAATESRGIRVHLFRELQTLLPDFQGFFAPSHRGYDFEGPVEFDLAEGLAIFVKRGFNAADHQHNFIASEQVGRKCRGIEIAPAYCDVIVERWEKFTGKKARLSNEQPV